jgi:hypothetical protein
MIQVLSCCFLDTTLGFAEKSCRDDRELLTGNIFQSWMGTIFPLSKLLCI